jgi:hypothetical protein
MILWNLESVILGLSHNELKWNDGGKILFLKRQNFENERQRSKIISIAIFSLAIAVLLDHLIIDIGWVAFLSGLLTGFSLVLNFTALYYYGKARQQIPKSN